MRFAIAQSGGPTCAINASLVGVHLELFANGDDSAHIAPIEVLGVRNGIQGLLEERFVNLNEALQSEDDVDLLRKTPSTALGSCRFRLPAVGQDDSIYQKIQHILEKNNIDTFFYIGGNDSMDTVAKLSAWLSAHNSPVKVIGVPKTIDNDLVCMDHTPGFGSAAKYVAMTIQEIIRDSSVYNVPSVAICEIMGRDAGWLTASTCVLRANGEDAPHLIYLPESDFSISQFLADVREQLAQRNTVICAVSEGVTPPDADCFRSGTNDEFGHAYLSGIGKFLETQVRNELGVKVRSMELNVMQRCSSHLASACDLKEAENVGRYAAKLAMQGRTGRVVTMRRVSDAPYRVEYSDTAADAVANITRKFPSKWISDAGNQISDEAVNYFLPLIQGEVAPVMRNGLPTHFRFAI